MSAHMLTTSSNIRAGRKPQLVRAHVVPHAYSRRHRHRINKPCGPSLMALSPLDSLFDLSPAHLLETEDFLGLERARVMAVDFVEDRDGFQIKADIPGVAKEDIQLDVDHNVLTISAKRSCQSHPDQSVSTVGSEAATQAGDAYSSAENKILQNDANVLRYERFDTFQSRSFRVPKSADLSTISAKYVDGVLTVNIQKQEDGLEFRRTVDIA